MSHSLPMVDNHATFPGTQASKDHGKESTVFDSEDIAPVEADGSTESDDNDWEDLISLATARNNLGLAYYQMEEYERAESLFEAALEEAKRRELERAELERRGEAGEIQVKRNAIASASSAAIIQKNLAMCLLKQGKLDQSEHHLKDTLDYLREEVGLRDHDDLVIDVFRQLSRVYTAMGKPIESAFYADKVARNEQRNASK